MAYRGSMKRILLVLCSAAALLAGPAFAGTRLSLGFHFGVPLYYGPPAYYYPPYYPYYYPPPVIYAPAPIISAPPPAMVERPVQPEAAVWFYCAAERGYYPYVRECPAGWERVPAAPPSGR
jgi:hypothetical protein